MVASIDDKMRSKIKFVDNNYLNIKDTHLITRQLISPTTISICNNFFLNNYPKNCHTMNQTRNFDFDTNY